MIHLHRWDIFYDLEHTELDYNINRIYRRCYTCHKWQREHYGYMEAYWEDSYIPVRVEDLIHQDKAEIIIKEINMMKNAQK